MESAPGPANDRLPEGRLTEWMLRVFALGIMAVIVANWGRAWWADTGHWTALLLLISESYTLGLILVARRAQIRDVTPLAVVATVYAMVYGALLVPAGTVRLAPEWFGATLLLLSIAWQFTAKFFLGRSFGLLPAQRGVVIGGPYRLVRHPIYLGYLIGHIGFLLTNFSSRNLVVLLLLYAAQVVRILREESVLSASSPAYQNYQQKVRWRLVPGVF